MAAADPYGARVVHPSEWGPRLPVVQRGGSCREIVGPRTGTVLRSLYAFELDAGARTVGLKHPHEAAYYVVRGAVSLEADGCGEVVGEGGLFHVTPYTEYRFTASQDAVVIGGTAPVDTGFSREARTLPTPEQQRDHQVSCYHRDRPGMLLPAISSDARLIIWYGSGAAHANMNYVVLEPGERNTEHVHRYSDDTIHILEGRGTAEDLTNGTRLPFGPGDTVTIPPGIVHAVAADQGERVVSVGGPCPADLDMLQAAGVDLALL